MSIFRTISGKEIDLISFNEKDVDINDIAISLSNICRYNGHTKRRYTVAEHSMNLARMLKGRFTAEALLHDACEAYLGDVSAPLKKHLKQYQAMENRFSKIIFNKFGLPAKLPREVIVADIAIRNPEMCLLMDANYDASFFDYDTFYFIEHPYRPFLKQLKESLNLW